MDFTQQTIAGILDWLNVEENQKLVQIVIAILVAVGGFLLWFFGVSKWFIGLFKRGSDAGDTGGVSISVGHGVGGDVITGGQKAEGGAAAVGGNVGGDLNIGYTPREHEAALQRRLDELRADLEAKQAAIAEAGAAKQELLQRDLDQLQKEKSEVERRIGDLDSSYGEAVAKIRELEALLARAGNEIGADRLDAARAALEQGDFSQADDLFAEIEARAAMAVQSAARAAYGRGEIAEEQVRWADAAEHYGRAAGLERDFRHLRKAWEFTHRAGDCVAALPLAKSLVEAAGSEFGMDTEEAANALNCQASTLHAMGRLDEAEPLYRQALEILRAKLGPDHPNTKMGEANYAAFRAERGAATPE